MRAVLYRESPLRLLRLLSAMAHVLAWIAFFGVVFWPFGYSMTTRTELSGGMVRFTFSHAPGPFMQYLGPLEVLLLLIPVALTGLAVLLVATRGVRSAWTKPALWALGVLCLVYCSVPIWFIEQADVSFIGAFFLPAALALTASATVASMRMPFPSDEPAPRR